MLPCRNLPCNPLENHPRNLNDDGVDEGGDARTDHLGVAGEELEKT